jgi:hypothetical protein
VCIQLARVEDAAGPGGSLLSGMRAVARQNTLQAQQHAEKQRQLGACGAKEKPLPTFPSGTLLSFQDGLQTVPNTVSP